MRVMEIFWRYVLYINHNIDVLVECYLSFQCALTAMQNLMELDYGWSELNSEFIYRVVEILASEKSPINVCRPATAILKKFVEADPMSAPGPYVASSSKAPPPPSPGSVYKFGFEVVFEQMRKATNLLETVVCRLGSADTTMALYRSVRRLFSSFHNPNYYI